MQLVYMDGNEGLRYKVKSADDDFQIFQPATDPQETKAPGTNSAFANLEAKIKARALQSRTSDPSTPRPYDNALVPATNPSP